MKKCLFAAVGLTAWIGFGSVEIGGLPTWEIADTEVSTNVPFAFPQMNVKHVLLSLELAGTPSNNVLVAFGRDTNTNGVLEVGEIGMTVGWDCGQWKVREGLRELRELRGLRELSGLRGLRELSGLRGLRVLRGVRDGEWMAEAVTTNLVKVLDVDLQVSHAKGKRLVCAENGESLDWGEADELPRMMYDNRWDTLRLTVRGVDRADESLRAAVRVDGSKIVIR